MRYEYAEASERLRRIREANNLSQAEMAEIASCSLRNYQNIESGKTQPGYHILNSIVCNLPADPRELFCVIKLDEGDVMMEHITRLLLKCNSDQRKLTYKFLQSVLEAWPK